MNEDQLRATIEQSMQHGHARILDDSLILTIPELVEAARAAQQGSDAAKQLVVNGMSRMVCRLSESQMRKWLLHLPAHSSFDDVFGDGLAGLHEGLRRFDADSGYAFTTYVAWWIRKGVQRAVYDLAGGGSIRAKALLAGVDLRDGLVGSNVASLDEPVGRRFSVDNDVDVLRHEHVAAPEVDLDLMSELMSLLSSVDSRLPEIATLLDSQVAYQEIARIVGLSVPRVVALLKESRVVLKRAGYS